MDFRQPRESVAATVMAGEVTGAPKEPILAGQTPRILI